MEKNELPRYDSSDNPTNCCPRFNPDGWDDQELHFDNKLFLKAETRSVFHIPTNMGRVYGKTTADIGQANAQDDEQFLVLSHDPSGWRSEHYFAVTRDVPGHKMVRLSGDYLTKVFEGPYRSIPKWEKEMELLVKAKGRNPEKSYYFYTTCPKCAKVYNKNYVVAVTKLEPEMVPA